MATQKTAKPKHKSAYSKENAKRLQQSALLKRLKHR
jgi:hypothetical protein